MSTEPLRPVSLPDLRLLGAPRHWQVDQPIRGLEAAGPVRGKLRALHHGNLLEVEASVHTEVGLCCDRCLNPFEHSLRADAHERLALEVSADAFDPLGEDLDDRLDPEGWFDPEQWLFEQLSLQLPLVSRCGAHCPGPATWTSSDGGGDPRWAALRHLGGD
jgi:uncharacterized protein